MPLIRRSPWIGDDLKKKTRDRSPLAISAGGLSLRRTPSRLAWAYRDPEFSRLCGVGDDPLRVFLADALGDLATLATEVRRLSEGRSDG